MWTRGRGPQNLIRISEGLKDKQLLYNYFLNAAPKNALKAKVIRKRKREVGLVVPAKYHAEMKSERISKILYKKLIEKKNTLKHFELSVDRGSIKEGNVVKTVVRVKY